MLNATIANTRPLQQPIYMSIALFLLFAFYGPSIRVFGELRYVEFALMIMLAFGIKSALAYMGDWERRFVSLFLLSALAQALSNIVNDATLASTLMRCGTLVILALLVVALRWLSKGDPNRIAIIVSGYCVSHVFILFVGTSTHTGYSTAPWRLGLGFAATMFLLVLVSRYRKLWELGPVLLFGMAIVHIAFESRSMALISASTAGLMLLTQAKPRLLPGQFDPVRVALAVILALASSVFTYFALNTAIENQWLPEEVQQKMEMQQQSEFGLLVAARPDTATAVYAIYKRPVLGHGSSNVDPEVWAFYSEVASSPYYQLGNRTGIRDEIYLKEWNLGTPSHSHLFGSWADGGIFAAICWMVILVVSIYVIIRLIRWQMPMAPLIFFVAISTCWDIIFSPGPHRMDMAIRLMIIAYALEGFRYYDVMQRLKSFRR